MAEYFDVEQRPDGVIELRPYVTVPAEQAWFWSERWQRMEREADEQIQRGELTTDDNAEIFLDHLENLRPD